MFNLFKKKSQNTVIIVDDNTTTATERIIASITNKYPVEVIVIHNEFMTAADRLVEQANTIIKEAESKDFTKVSRLEGLGFKQANQVTELKPLIKKTETSKEHIDLIKYYGRNYPLNKFITEEQVEKICIKWNLVCGEVSRYKGFVPEKNLKEIERFKLKSADKGIWIGNTYLHNGEVRRCRGYYHVYKIGEPWNSYAYQSNDGVRFYSSDDMGIFGGAILTGNQSYRDNGLMICAPVKDMDMNGMTIEKGYRMREVPKEIPDPVVLHPVKGGYLILTAWGDEASDPIVVNNINN